MNRPIPVTIIAWIYIVVGVGGIAAHISEFNPRHPFEADSVLALIVRSLAIIAGIFMLRGKDWARWLAIAWIAFHVGISAFHSMRELAIHAALLAIFTFLLLRPTASTYFRQNSRFTT